MGFPGSSVGKESSCNAGNPSLIPGSGRSPGEGTGYPFQYSWASLVAQMVMNPPTMQKTWVRSLGWEDPLKEGMETHSSILAWRIPWTEEPDGLQTMGSQRVGHDWVTKHSTALCCFGVKYSVYIGAVKKFICIISFQIPHIRDDIWYFPFSVWLTLLSMTNLCVLCLVAQSCLTLCSPMD